MKTSFHKTAFIRARHLPPRQEWVSKSQVDQDFGRVAELQNTVALPLIFGWKALPLSSPPRWHRGSTNRAFYISNLCRWWECEEVVTQSGDIKDIWEQSRMGWAVSMAQLAVAGEPKFIDTLNEWIDDWNSENPPFYGPNWICSQEASFRVINLAASMLILGRETTKNGPLPQLVLNHLKRIGSTLGYSKAQANNHIILDAAALFIGGSWLESEGEVVGRKFTRKGRLLLEKYLRLLVYPDGEFSQHSANYQRLVNDCLVFVEVWRIKKGQLRFSEDFYLCAGKVNAYLSQVTVGEGGAAPFFGGNDGAHLLPILGQDYADFLPSVDLGRFLFRDGDDFAKESVVRYCAWFRLNPEDEIFSAQRVFSESDIRPRMGGLKKLSRGQLVAFVRLPGFQFRPANADVLHVDIWSAGRNIVRDSGSYDYGAPVEDLRAYHGSYGHNAVIFDQRDQMPMVSRFLFSDWLTESEKKSTKVFSNFAISGSIIDRFGNQHVRKVELFDNQVIVTDVLKGDFVLAETLWRLIPAEWSLSSRRLSSELGMIEVDATSSTLNMSLGEAKESRYYKSCESIPMLNVQVSGPCEVITKFNLLT